MRQYHTETNHNRQKPSGQHTTHTRDSHAQAGFEPINCVVLVNCVVLCLLTCCSMSVNCVVLCLLTCCSMSVTCVVLCLLTCCSMSVTCVVLCLLTVLFYVLFVFKCVPYYCHRVSTQFQLTNIYNIRNSSNRATADARLGPLCHGDRL
jgi:uncharacterized membrane protein